MDALTKKKADRFRYLNRLYEQTDGDKFKIVEMNDIGGELGLHVDVTRNVVDYLVGEGLIEYRALGGGISITHSGVVEVERALSEPERPTQYFPAVVNVLQVQSMVGSQIQQGTHSSTQLQTVSRNDIDSLKTLVAAMRNALPQLPLEPSSRTEAEADLQTIIAQLQSPRPKFSILQESLRTLRNLIEGVASNGLAAGLLPLFAPLVQCA